MPAMWEAEMYKDEVDEDGCQRAREMRELAGEKMLGDDDRDWQDLVVSLPARLISSAKLQAKAWV